MAKSNLLIACLFTLIAGNALAQRFPAKPLTLICPFPKDSSPDQHLRPLAQIASRYLGQRITVENKSNWSKVFPPAEMARTAPPDGYHISLLTISAFRIPHMQDVSWDPTKDFTYVIGLAGYTFGVVVKTDSQIKSLTDLIDYAKANPEGARYASAFRGSSPHLAMEDLGLKTGARFLHAPSAKFADTAKALIDGRLVAISESAIWWGPNVDSGAFRLLVTFGEQRSRWNAPTARDLGFDIVSYAPIGIVGPKGIDPKVTKLLHDAFYRALDDPEYDRLLSRLDMVDWYKSSDDYAEWAVDQFRFQRALIERTIGLGRGLRN